MRSGNQCFLPCFATDITNKYDVKQNPSALINSEDETLPDEADRWWFLNVFVGDMTPPTLEMGSVCTISGHWNSVEAGILFTIDYL